MPAERVIKLQGRLFLRCSIQVKTGLHIGASSVGLEIGGVDNPILRDPITGQPYIPGSSLKGKLRSLTEKRYGLPQNHSMGQRVWIHMCERGQGDLYRDCPVCHIYGVTGDIDYALPTRLAVRDSFLSPESAARLEKADTDLPYTEVKYEASIDRVTSHAHPRPVERVPAGAVFSPVEMVLNVYQPRDVTERLGVLLEALGLLEDDYLGGLGSRGGGQIAFANLRLSARASDSYQEEHELAAARDLHELLAASQQAQQRARTLLFPET